jgi:hypothetical protein
MWLWAIGAVLLGLFIARFGVPIGAGLEAIGAGISRLLSPRIEPYFVPVVGIRWEMPELKVPRGDYRWGYRPPMFPVRVPRDDYRYKEWQIELIRERRRLR